MTYRDIDFIFDQIIYTEIEEYQRLISVFHGAKEGNKFYNNAMSNLEMIKNEDEYEEFRAKLKQEIQNA